MAEKFNNTYRIASARAQWWDYGWNGAYFITICTKNRNHFFGEIKNETMILSQMGIIADILWYEISNHAPHVELGEFVVMPNHIHGILILDKPTVGDNNNDSDIAPAPVETLHATSLRQQQRRRRDKQPESQTPSIPSKNKQMADISPKSQSVSVIMRSYKSAVTKHANRLGFENG